MEKYKYSLWKIVHENVFFVSLDKVKDTNNINEVVNWMDQDCCENGASFYYPRDYYPADSIYLFNNN
jgi:hypothetical protein